MEFTRLPYEFLEVIVDPHWFLPPYFLRQFAHTVFLLHTYFVGLLFVYSYFKIAQGFTLNTENTYH